jgi:alpha,alpha-trehalose phosphorylase
VTGPDEYTCIVNNNYYTNLSAQNNLRGAASVYEDLRAKGLSEEVRQKLGFDERELAQFRQAADAMFLPYDEKLGIYAQDDSFLDKPVWDFAATPAEHYPLLLHYAPLTLYRHQVCKQADTILAHVLYDDGVDPDVMRRGYEYYERITTHDSTLSVCIFSIMAARLGLTESAYQYFMNSIRTDLGNTHRNTKDGLHTANMGGAYLALTAGFAGLRIRQDGLHFHFTLPEQWKGYTFKLWYQGSRLCVKVGREQVRIRLEKGNPVRIRVDGVPYDIVEEQTIRSR